MFDLAAFPANYFGNAFLVFVRVGAMLFSAPPVLFYLVMQRYIVSGLTAGAVKG